RMLVVGQVALSLALVAGAGLLVGSFRRLVTLDPGFKRQGVLLVSADFGNSGFDRAKRDVVTADLLRRLRALPGVSSASVSAMTPIGGFFWNGFVEVPGFTPKNERDALADFNKGSDGYFATLQTPILEGRDFGPLDAANSPLVAIINQAMATKFFGGADPLGRQFQLQQGTGSGPMITVVGVTANAHYASLEKDPEPQAYFPMSQGFDLGPEVVFEVRGPPDPRGAPAAMQGQIKDLLLSASPAVSITFRSFDAQINASLARPRLMATLSGFFGALALLLAVIGIYGVISYGVTRRRNEIGIRIALGAAGSRVIRMVVGEAGLLVALGTVFGIGVTIVGTRFVASFLYGVTATDPVTIGGAALVLAAIALGAATVPAWRASRVDPMEVLREE
ncbi:MAG: FtsX-like permease family protein, partial [Gemmatimonadales bacterium]